MINCNLKSVRFLLAAVVILTGAGILMAQKKENNRYPNEFCSEKQNWSSSTRVSATELREFTLPAGALKVDGKRNGGIRVIGEARNDVRVRACVQTWAPTDAAAKAVAANIRIETSGTLRAESASEENNWGVTYEIYAPRTTDLNLTTLNGGISISEIDGMIRFTAYNGGVTLDGLAGDVRGKTTNGGLNVTLAGERWEGVGLDVVTTNGGVKVSLSKTYAAQFDASTVNGGIKSGFPASDADRVSESWRRPRGRISEALNGGGAPIRVATTNGGIHIEQN